MFDIFRTFEVLRDADVDFVKAFSDLYGPGSMTIESAYILHMPLQVNLLSNCWGRARKHTSINQFGSEIAVKLGKWHKGIL